MICVLIRLLCSIGLDHLSCSFLSIFLSTKYRCKEINNIELVIPIHKLLSGKWQGTTIEIIISLE